MAETRRNVLAEFDDPAVVERLIAGDENEHNRLYEKALPALAALVKRTFGKKTFTDEDSFDIATDAILSARHDISGFNTERQGKLSAWLLTIAFNEARDCIRWRKSPNRDPLDRSDIVFMDNPDSLESSRSGTATPQPLNVIPEGTEVFSEKKVNRLRAAVERIPASERHEVSRQVFRENLSEEERIVLSCKMNEVSDKEIGKKLGITDNYVRVMRTRALNNWAEELERRLEADER